MADLFKRCRDFTASDDAKAAGFYPYFLAISNSEGTEAVIKGKTCLMLGSNNYLGLTTHPKVREAAAGAISQFGTSCLSQILQSHNSAFDLEDLSRLSENS